MNELKAQLQAELERLLTYEMTQFLVEDLIGKCENETSPEDSQYTKLMWLIRKAYIVGYIEGSTTEHIFN